ncbi:MAG TPA: hypothetical protein PLY62_09050 [Bacteroidales bacterium]|nr:hypothetical protein [Bacteroidales bacterium]
MTNSHFLRSELKKTGEEIAGCQNVDRGRRLELLSGSKKPMIRKSRTTEALRQERIVCEARGAGGVREVFLQRGERAGGLRY